MTYNQLLNEYINKSGKTAKEIQFDCKQRGQDVTAAYIRILKKEKDKIPSKELSRAIEQSCGGIGDELIIESFYEHAPEEINKIFDEIKGCILEILTMTGQDISKVSNDISHKKLLECCIDVLKMITKAGNNKIVQDIIKTYHTETEKEIYTVNTDKLSPDIEKGKKYNISKMPIKRIIKGDIIAIRIKQKIEYRYFGLVDSEIIVSYDKEKAYRDNINDIEIIGIIEKE